MLDHLFNRFSTLRRFTWTQRTKLESGQIDNERLNIQADEIIKKLQNLLKKEDFEKTNEFLIQLKAVADAYALTGHKINDARNAQVALFKDLHDKNIAGASEKIKPAIEKFNSLYKRMSEHITTGMNKVPPIPPEIKNQVPADLYQQLEEARRRTGITKTLGDRAYKTAEVDHAKIVGIRNEIATRINSMQSNQSAPSQPAPSAPQCPSFLHSNQGAQQKAAAANLPASAQPQNPSTQPKK